MDDRITITLRSDSEARTRAIAANLAKRLRGGEVIALEGELGAGKTCFVRGLAEGLGLNPNDVSSPTFVICQEYGGGEATDDRLGLSLVHLDAYRISDPVELETIGWNEILEDETNVIAIEWPSRIVAALPPHRFDVRLDHVSDHERVILIAAPAGLADRIRNIAAAPVDRLEKLRCRTCGRAVARVDPHFPFCSERCRLADLGKWFSESYRTSRAAEADDELE